jgi:hypothetical protein
VASPDDDRDALAEAHAQLARQKSFSDALLETIQVGVVSCDASGVVVVSNRAEREIFDLDRGLDGLAPAELAPLIVAWDADGRRLVPDTYPLVRALRGEDVAPVDVTVGPEGGPQREIVVRASQIRDADGGVLGAVAALTDVTAERTAIRALVAERRTSRRPAPSPTRCSLRARTPPSSRTCPPARSSTPPPARTSWASLPRTSPLSDPRAGRRSSIPTTAAR